MFKHISKVTLIFGIGIGVAAAAMITACAEQTRSESSNLTVNKVSSGRMLHADRQSIVDPNDSQSFVELLSELETNRVIFVGETHDRYDHHLNQLAVICGLRQRGVDLAVGLEFFQAPFQRFLDQYVAGEVEEKEFLKKTEYYQRWKYDYRLYRDILAYARENAIPLVALNAPTELVARVSKRGIVGLTPEERTRLSHDLAPPGPAYVDRLRSVFEMHGNMSAERFRRFVDVQLLWDEYMARVAADYLKEQPGKTLVILAGSGHVAYLDAIPGRLSRMVKARQAVVVTGSEAHHGNGAVDFFVAERDIELEKPGRLGMMLASEDDGVSIREVRSASPAEKAGFLPGDQIRSIAGEPVSDMQDVRLAMLDRSPGEEVWVEIYTDGESRNSGTSGRELTLL